MADVYAVAWRRLKDVPADDPLPWLLAVARNHWRNHLRKARKQRELVARSPLRSSTHRTLPSSRRPTSGAHWRRCPRAIARC